MGHVSSCIEDCEVRAAELAARSSYGKLLAILAARDHDLAAAEDALSEAFLQALQEWPKHGAPRVPEAWLLTVARNRLADRARSLHAQARVLPDLQYLLELDIAQDDSPQLPDKRLAMMFACAHPAIEVNARAPLMLQTVLGLGAARIASACLITPAAMSQRLVRAKNKIRDHAIPFEVPDIQDLPQRLPAMLDAIYAIYSEAWASIEGADDGMADLASEAIWLARLLATLLPEQAEVLGLLALMLYCSARTPARRESGAYVALSDQNPALWNAAMIVEAEDLLRRASSFRIFGRYQIEAAVQSVHCARRHSGNTDWQAILSLYQGLKTIVQSPVVEINLAIALAEVDGPENALPYLETMSSLSQLADFQPYWAALANMRERCGLLIPAVAAYTRAAGLERDPAVRAYLQARIDNLNRQMRSATI